MGLVAVRALPPMYGDILALAKSVFGKKLQAVIVYGQAARPHDFPPHSDVNVAVITSEAATPQERMEFYSQMGRHVVPVFLTVDQLRELAEKGDMFAYTILRDSIVLMDRGVVSDLSSAPLDFSALRAQARRQALSALGVAAQNLWRGAYGEAINYMYRSLRALLQWFCAERGVEPPQGDKDLCDAARGMGAPESCLRLMEEIREMRVTGAAGRKCHDTMERLVREVKDVLGLKGVSWTELCEKLSSARPASFVAYEEGGELKWRVKLVLPSGRLEEIES